MKVPPSKMAASNRPPSVGQATLAKTPAASTALASAKALRTPRCRPTAIHTATDGIAARPSASQNTGSMAEAVGEARTMATMKVAVIT